MSCTAMRASITCMARTVTISCTAAPTPITCGATTATTPSTVATATTSRWRDGRRYLRRFARGGHVRQRRRIRIDLADYSPSTAGVQVDLATSRGTGGFAAGDRYDGIENVTGSRFGDTITGDGWSNVLRGGDGVDVIAGGGGNDVVIGGAGADQLDGGSHTTTGDDLPTSLAAPGYGSIYPWAPAGAATPRATSSCASRTSPARATRTLCSGIVATTSSMESPAATNSTATRAPTS